jgi:hypothetical protein
MQRAVAIAAALALLVLPGCGSSGSDTAIRKVLERGVAQIGEPQTAKQLHDDLERTLARLRSERASTATGRKARTLAIQGFNWMLKGVEARLEITRNDSGNLEASVRDAKRADRDMSRGASFLRAAGRAVGIRIGKLNGF